MTTKVALWSDAFVSYNEDKVAQQARIRSIGPSASEIYQVTVDVNGNDSILAFPSINPNQKIKIPVDRMEITARTGHVTLELTLFNNGIEGQKVKLNTVGEMVSINRCDCTDIKIHFIPGPLIDGSITIALWSPVSKNNGWDCNLM